ncbi:MAG: hypothetical protein JZU52_15835 [Lamprocystis purpurea]|jgi:hypothetical protein|uniref:hypothetical protein n=1 Tax=Lamprocystis purpurea TaxID=61598 RepID=UPI00037F8C47|nr:hypothetical protein [Lamprocystis purpurea]MBV5275043.1 hypothetical protein [Lamprocystis purpurea]
MDRKQLNEALRAFFAAHQTVRYQGVVIAVKSQDDFSVVRSQIEAILLEHDVWETPGEGTAPDIPCVRRNFFDAVFLPRKRGLVIFSPKDWMLDWSEQDEATFWTGIADAFGRHEIVIMTVATPPVIAQLRVSLAEHELGRLPFSIWLSRHQSIDHLQGVLS